MKIHLLRGKPQNLAFVLMILYIAAAQAIGQPVEDTHRPACTSPECRKIKPFLKTHYCGQSPFGNSPDHGCEIRSPKKVSATVKVTASLDCDWSETEGKSRCQQHGQPSETILNILVRETRQIDLPAKADKELHFIVWESNSPKCVADRRNEGPV